MQCNEACFCSGSLDKGEKVMMLGLVVKLLMILELVMIVVMGVMILMV